jgi:hypothetical protein
MTNTAFYPQPITWSSFFNFLPVVELFRSIVTSFTENADAGGPVNVAEIRERQSTLEDRLFDDSDELKPFERPSGGGDGDPGKDDKGDDDGAGDDGEGDKGGSDDGEEDDSEEGEKDKDKDKDKDEDFDYEKDSESMARKTARENGRRLKELEAQHADLIVKHTTAEKERDELRQRVQQYEQVTIDPRTTPAYQEVLNEMWNDVDAAIAEELPPVATELSNKFSKYVAQYLPTLRMQAGERAAAVAKLKETIAVELGGHDVPYEELLEDDRVAADELARQVLAVVRRNAPRATKLIEIENEVRERAKKGRLASGVREYEDRANFIKQAIKPVGELDDKLIEQDPEIPEAIVTRMAKEDPDFDARLKSAKSDIEELLAGGPKPLTEAEMDALEEQGVDLNEYQKRRLISFRERVKKNAPLLVRGLALAHLTNKTLTTYAKEHLKERKKRDELAVLDSLRRHNDVKATAAEKEKLQQQKAKENEDPRKRPLAVDSIFGPE